MCNQQTVISTTGHAVAFYASHPGKVYSYDPTDDGPEVDIITRIRLFNDRYGRLGKKRQETVRKFVIMLHVDGKGIA